VCAIVLAACSGSGGHSTLATSVPTTFAPVVTTTTASGTVPASTTAPTAPPPTSSPCPAIAPPSTPLTSAPTTVTVFLTTVRVASDRCADRISFAFRAKTAATPGYRVTYSRGPFVEDASGAPKSVAGTAFVVVRLAPASGFEFETATQVYNGLERIAAPGARRVAEVVRTGDNEGAMTWVIGLDRTRPYRVTATHETNPRLVITVG
jgi:hypothetical protein